jgi:outer membrane protein assembly factor BamB
MAFEGDLVFASGRIPKKDLLCVRADGSGDVTETHVKWRTNKLVTYVPSPLVHEGRLYVVNDDGIARCLDANTGKEFWKKRLDGKFSASPLLAAGNIFATNETGTTFVFRAGPKYELVSRNEIGEECLASPLICGGRVFLRTGLHLYCLGDAEPPQSGPEEETSK